MALYVKSNTACSPVSTPLGRFGCSRSGEPTARLKVPPWHLTQSPQHTGHRSHTPGTGCFPHTTHSLGMSTSADTGPIAVPQLEAGGTAGQWASGTPPCHRGRVVPELVDTMGWCWPSSISGVESHVQSHGMPCRQALGGTDDEVWWEGPRWRVDGAWRLEVLLKLPERARSSVSSLGCW